MEPRLVVITVLTALIGLSSSQNVPPLEWIPMSDASVTLPPGDDAATEIITPIGFPFGNAIHHNIYIITNGLISFDTPFTSFFNQQFPGTLSNFYLIAPFWDDANTNTGGSISYEIHTSGDVLQTVSEYVSAQIGTEFQGYWMMVVRWEEIPPFFFFFSSSDTNTFQAALIMDSNQNSYAIFIYECGLLEWDNFGTSTIGYNTPDHFDNHDPHSVDVACVNQPQSGFSNVFYTLHEAEPLPTVPPQTTYMDFLEHTSTAIISGNLLGCDDCVSEEIILPGDLPFGNYYHQSAYVGSNGHMSFRIDYTHFDAELFPTTNPNIYWDFVVAPFWSDADLRLEGRASWEIHDLMQSEELVNAISVFIQQNYDGAENFSGTWMIVAFWEDVHPWPHGVGFNTPFTLSENTYQAIVITDGMKSYAVYTYRCGEMEWGDESTIGYNAGGDDYMNHPITGHFLSHFIACLQNISNGNPITNVIYDLVPDVNALLPGAIPPIHNTIGSCVEAGFTECCTEGDCRGLPLAGSCYCDALCDDRGDCCYDEQFICPTGLLTDDYIVLAEDTSILHMSLNGTDIETLYNDINMRAYGIDYHLADGVMVWSDTENNKIYKRNLNGTGLVTELVTTNIAGVDDVAIDWIGNNLYWVDSLWARIEVMNLDTRSRRELLQTGPNTNPRAIAVDPTTRMMYWSDLIEGGSSKIERASMDGTNRQFLFGFLIQPNGLTVDIVEQKLYWCDTTQNTIVYASLTSTGISDVNTLVLNTPLSQPLSLAVSGTSIYWTESGTDSIQTTHKQHGAGDGGHQFTIYTSPSGVSPRGIAVVSSSQQPTANIDNPCNGSGCSDICLLSTNAVGFKCVDGTTQPTAPPAGLCADAHYTTCCEHGSCAGYPATCFCDIECYDRFDCCLDMPNICNEVPPVGVLDLTVYPSATSLTLSFVIPYLVHGTEEYAVFYGLTNIPDMTTETTTITSADFTEFSITINNLLPGTTYYMQLSATNDIGVSVSGVFSATTIEDAPSGPPQDFFVYVNGTSITLTWSSPLEEERNGIIISYTVSCSGGSGDNFLVTLNPIFVIQFYSLCPNTEYSCSVAASTAVGIGPFTFGLTAFIEGDEDEVVTFPWIPMGVLFGAEQQFLPATDDGFEGPIEIEPGFPFGSSIQTQVFVGTNGLISFETGYNSFVNQPFPGSSFINTRYLVAPYWDDVDIRFDTGEISYEIHTSGLFLDQVNCFIRRTRPTDFEGTWMMVAFYDAVHPYFGLFNSEENTFQVILITDGTYSYTIFTYLCGLLEWDNGVTIGFNAASEIYENFIPSSSAVACLNIPYSVWSNVVYRLSAASNELPPPSNVETVNTTLNSTTIQWVVATVDEPQQYVVMYGNSSIDLSYATDPISSVGNQANQIYQVEVSNLTQGTTYYVQVVSIFGSFSLTSSVISFTTLEPAIEVAPLVFEAVATGTSVTFSWTSPIVEQVIVAFNLSCEPGVEIEVKPINMVTLYDLPPETTLYCTLAASSSGGYGPPTPVIIVTTGDALAAETYFSFIPMDIHANFYEVFLPSSDDGTVGPIEVPGGLPFSDTVQTDIYIGTNGLISFDNSYNPFSNVPLPVPEQVLVAPFWDDVDIRFGSGQISYEVHTSGYFLKEVSEFIRRRRPMTIQFTGTWMLIVYWDAVRPYFGLFNPEENTFQAVIITDGTYSYALFTYNCGLMEWDNGVTIGISDGADFYDNFVPSSSEVACLNVPVSDFSNVIYRLSEASPELPPPSMVAITGITQSEATISWNIPVFLEQEEYVIEYGQSATDLNLLSDPVLSITDANINFQPYSQTLSGLQTGTLYFFRIVARFGTGGIYVRYSDLFAFITEFEPQTQYLPFLPHTDTSIDNDMLLPCENCSSFQIIFPSNFPFGGYYHQSAYVNTNGYISFGTPLIQGQPEGFPPESVNAFWSYMVAVFWADFDTTIGGSVSWELHDRANSLALVQTVDSFIAGEYGDSTFEGSWMLVAHWENVEPSDNTNGNTFQAILTTNGIKSYAVLIFRCGSLSWPDSATIGFYAPTTTAYYVHPLSTVSVEGANIRTDEIACLHSGSLWSNVIFELEISNHILEMTPEPGFSTGSCVEAGFTGCCTSGCFQDGCYCDAICHFFQDCCYDIDETCPATAGSSYDLLVGHGDHISQIHFEGTSSETVRTDTTGRVVGVDYLDSESLMFWSDVTTDTIHRAALDASNEETIVDSCISTVDDIAVDWVSNKLYWVDASWARIEALDLYSNERVEVLLTGTNTAPRAIAVDPINRAMYWTDYGVVAKIETAAMNGDERRILHFSEISQPNGIAIDYLSERIYWSDAGLDRIEYSNFDGSNRNVVENEGTGLLHPFAVTIADNILFWSDWETQKIYATHKEHGTLDEQGFFTEIVTFLDRPYGVEALRADRQPAAVNPCINSGCSHVCLLTFTNEQGFTCACPEGYEFENETFCKPQEEPTYCTLTPGSCAAYSSCCEAGFCAGTPANCFCDADCRIRGDCCSDINDTCIDGWPRLPRDITVTGNTGTSVTISWLIPYIESSPELYTVVYGTASDSLVSQTAISSGSNTFIINQVYTRTILGLEYVTTYYFRITVTNDIGTASTEILSFTTAEGPPSAAPTDFDVYTIDTMVCLSWGPPPEGERNGFIISYTVSCDVGGDTYMRVLKGRVNSTCIDPRITSQDFTCSTAASTGAGIGPATSSITVTTGGSDSGVLPFLALNATYSVDTVVLPESDDGTFGPIELPVYGFPFWSSNRETAYIAINGLLSFDQPYDFFFNEQFPGFFSSGRYLVAPFWEDADTRGGRGVVSYEVHESGYMLEHVSAYLQSQRPSTFQGTWMLVVFYDAVQPYFFNTGENSYQVILITDGNYTYTIFTYDCNLMEWGTSATVGFNANDDPFMNHPYITYQIACLNLPDSNIYNVIYRLSENDPEYVLPQDVEVVDIDATTVTVQWTVPSVITQQQYRVLYGTGPELLNQTSTLVTGDADITLTDQQYSVGLFGLTIGSDYYFRLSIMFDDVEIVTELYQFRTLDDPPSVAPASFMASVIGVAANLTWAPPPNTGTIVSYTIFCSVGGVEEFRAVLKPVLQFLFEELRPATTYACGIYGATSGGDGPSAIISFATEDIATSGFNLPFVLMNTLLGTEETLFPEADDSVEGPFSIPPGFPFGSSLQTDVFVGTNGILSFGSGYGSFFNRPFPGNAATMSRYLVAPFWDDVDTRSDSGDVSYEVHTSGYYLDQVNLFLQRNRPSIFQGEWMMVVYWNAVNPYFGAFQTDENTFQAILITDGMYSYTIFTYKCSLMEWDNGATIGYNAAGESFDNYDPSSSEVACLNAPTSDYSNVIYLLSNESPEIPVPEDVLIADITTSMAEVSWTIPSFAVQEQYYVAYGTDPNNLTQVTHTINSPVDTSLVNQRYSTTLSGLLSGTIYYIEVVAVYNEEFVRYTEAAFLVKEPEQAAYLIHLQPLLNEGTELDPCDDCTSGEIEFPTNFPFGGYYHQTAYVSTNGLISFGREVTNSDAVLFPSDTTQVSESYILAPFWADFNTNTGGSVFWWIEEAPSSSHVIPVTTFIQEEYGDSDFSATWVLVASWEDLTPGSKFQAVLATDGISKSYAIYTYTCGELEWSDSATIGLNTPSDYVNHPLSGTELVDQIACIHQESDINNLIYELQTGVVVLPVTPEPMQFSGSCVAAGFTDCCTGFNCLGSPPNCYCDNICVFFNDCCSDFYEICLGTSGSGVPPEGFDLLVGHGHHISQVHYEGTSTETIRTDTTGTVVGVDYLFTASLIFWSDVTTDTIHRATMNGTEEEIIASTDLISVDDIAVDWVSGKLYWTDAGWARVEAMDMESLIRVELIRTGINTVPRAIALDPIRRVMYWTDWGRTAKIESASMDGSERRDFVITDISEPNGITVDLDSERVYWSDADLERLEYISFDGTGRTLLETEDTGLQDPFAVSVGDDILFWSDLDTNSVYATHKEHGSDDGNGYFATVATFTSAPFGVEALLSDRQPLMPNPCEDNECSHVCLLSEVEADGFVCACPLGYELDTTTLCKVTGDTATPTPPPAGSCIAAGYAFCCEHGFCAGYPATCFCDEDCYDREDCCSDITNTCVEGAPRAPTNIQVTDIGTTSARIRWVIPFITSTQEGYYVQYGLDPVSLMLQSDTITSGPNISSAYSHLLINLDPEETYYFLVIASNDAGLAGSDLYSFMTLSGPPSGPPLDFSVTVDVTAMMFSWSPPDLVLQNGVITSYTLSCTYTAFSMQQTTSVSTSQFQYTIDLFTPGLSFGCSVYATNANGNGPPTASVFMTTETVQPGSPAYLPFLELGENQVVLPSSDEGISGAIALPETGFPFWSTNRSTVYVAVNGLLSFDTNFSFYFNVPFPGYVRTLYLVAPFWDDVDTRFGNGRVLYEVYESGYALDSVSAFIRRTNPSSFQGTWMLVSYWDSVRPYHGLFNSAENSFQAILITDGTYSYAVFTYDYNLLEWGSTATIGFNAGGEAFQNNPYTNLLIASSSLPESNITNVVYPISEANLEYPAPQNVQIDDIQFTTVTLSWVVPYTLVYQQYSVVYGVDPDVLDQIWGLQTSSPDLDDTNQMFTETIFGLTQGVTYYARISSMFGYSIIYSDLVSFTTLEPAPTGPPLNFVIDVTGTTLELSWDQPAPELRSGLIRFYTLVCSSGGQPAITFSLKNVTMFSLDDFTLDTEYTCSVSASTSGGTGPSTSATSTTASYVDNLYLPLIRVGSLTDGNSVQLEEADDEVSDPIDMPDFPFGNSTQTIAYVGTNGLLSIDTPHTFFFNTPFSEFSRDFLVAPFWDDVDIRGGNGEIFYEVFDGGYYLDTVNTFLQRQRPSSFEGTWMLAAYWDAVHPFFGAASTTENTFEAILITDGTYSYAIFTYKCGLLEWDNGVTIGFKASGDFYANNDPSSADVACLNTPESEYSNVIYVLSETSPEIPLPDMVTGVTSTNSVEVSWRIPSFTRQEQYYIEYGTDRDNLDQRTELIDSVTDTTLVNVTYTQIINDLSPGAVYYLNVVAVYEVISRRRSELYVLWTNQNEQAYYLEFLDLKNDDDAQVVEVEDCFNGCSSPEIRLPYDFPFGGYFHRTAFVNTNGVITFGVPIEEAPQLFPPTFWSYAVAPLWQIFNTTQGAVRWKVYDNFNHTGELASVDTLIQAEQGDATFTGLWMLVASWENVGYFVDDTLITDSFQAVLITNGVKSYAIFTYQCDDSSGLPGPLRIGYNAPPTEYYNHPLAFTPFDANTLACSIAESEWNNVIIDLQPGNVILPTTPQPALAGSCRDAGYEGCCLFTGGLTCAGTPYGSPPCYCDTLCLLFGDCCFDADHTCNAPTYDLLVGNGNHLTAVHFEGTVSESLQMNFTGNVVGVDYHAERSLIFWSDTMLDTIHQADQNGENDIVLVNTNIQAVDDIAVDWIANNLYWVDSVWARIEALNLDSMERTEVLRVGANTRPRAIAVDPINRVMFWTDWGQTAKIERAFLDGEERRTVHDVGLSQPNGITIDYDAGKIYWTDSGLDKIEYSNYDGSARTILEALDDGILHPFALTIVDELLFWTDWETNYLYYTHKDHGNTDGLGIFQSLAHFTSTPYGVEALTFNGSRQAPGENPCANSECEHICLLSATNDAGYVCGCAAGADLQNDDKSCSQAPEPVPGSCMKASYDSCCGHGACAGNPATCSCNPDCHVLGDCCSDIDEICPESLPNEPTFIQVSDQTHVRARITWIVPSVVFTSETYTLSYGTAPNNISTQTEPMFSGIDITVKDQEYSVTLEGLSSGTTYYYRISAQNTLGETTTGLLSFTTPFVGPPQNFVITVEGTETLTFSWDLPLEIEFNEIDYFVIDCEPKFQHDITEIVMGLSATLEEFLPGTTYTCTVTAKTNELGAPAEQTATTEEAPDVLPFLVIGMTEGVERVTLPPSDDATSAPIYITGGLPLGSTTHTIAHVGTNGIISLGQPWLFWNPELFPTENYYVHTSYVAAPFWSDIDTRLAGSVSYEAHQRGLNTASNAVLERVSGFIAAQANTSFTATWMLIAQWNGVHPFPHGSAGTTVSEQYALFLNSENTFQVIIITDGMQNFAIYTYQCDLMEWSGEGEGLYATIGYNLNGVYENHPLSGTMGVRDIAQCPNDAPARRQATSSWTNLIYQLPSAVNLLQELRAQCLTSEILDIQSNGAIQPLSTSLGACPPSVAQAFLDFRFIFSDDISTTSSRCYIHVFATGNTDLASLICCYAVESSTFGALLVGGSEGSSMALFHPLHYSTEYGMFDKDFRDKCCGSGLCDVFHARRPIDPSLNYIPPFFGFGNGDPHIVTLDGATYTFNGRGEYTLVEVLSTGFALQARTEPVSETSNATQFSAFAMGIKDEDLATEIRLSRGRLVSFINGEDVSDEIEEVDATTNGSNNAIFMTRTGVDTVRMLLYKDQLAYVFTVTRRGEILDFIINLENSLRGETKGLFGNFNGDTTDDYIKPNGIQVSSDASDQMLHDYGQSWQIIEQESLFTYPVGTSFIDYTFPDHIAPLLSDVVASAPASVVEMCNSNPQCIFDAVQTGDLAIGMGTLDTIDSNNNDVMVANNFPPTITGDATFRITVGVTSSYSFTAIDDASDTVVVTIEGLSADDYTLIQNGNSYTLSIDVTIGVPIIIVATDSMNVVSTLSPTIEICACQNGGNCTLDGVLATGQDIIIMLCECPPGWEGPTCEQDKDGCAELTCFPGLQCYDAPAPLSGAVCEACPDGYQGDGEKCKDVDECSSTEISSSCGQMSICINTPGSYMCSCVEGYELSDTTGCTDLNECLQGIDNCQQECTNTDGSYTCSCRAGYDLGGDGITCTVSEPCVAGSITCDANGECVVINGVPTCSCTSGYVLDNDGQTCNDVDECQNELVCEEKCNNSVGTYTCECRSGYTLSSNQRDCIDINECLESGTSLCEATQICQNNDGSYVCACPPGTELNGDGECMEIEITKPPVVVIPPTGKPTEDPTGRSNSVNVTLTISKERFDAALQFSFRIDVASEVAKYCIFNERECGFDPEELPITFNDVIILDEIVNDANGKATFLVFVYTKSPTDVLSNKILQIILSDVDLVSSAAAVISGESGRSSDGITDGGVAAIVIVLILVVGAVLIVAAFLLYRYRESVPKVAMLSNISMGDMFRGRGPRSSMLIEEDVESMKDTASVGGDVTEAKAREAAAEEEAKLEPEPPKPEEKQEEETKIDLSTVDEAEEAL